MWSAPPHSTLTIGNWAGSVFLLQWPFDFDFTVLSCLAESRGGHVVLWNTFLTERSLLFQPLGYLSALLRLPPCAGCLATWGWSNQTMASAFPSPDWEMIYWWNCKHRKPSLRNGSPLSLPLPLSWFIGITLKKDKGKKLIGGFLSHTQKNKIRSSLCLYIVIGTVCFCLFILRQSHHVALVVDQASLELTKIYMLLPPESWD